MAYTLSKCMMDVYDILGELQVEAASGGSTTTAVVANLAGMLAGDDTAYQGGTLFVQTDAGGAGDAPEGEYARISSYDDSTGTFTIATLSTAIASGDTVAFAGLIFPAELVKRHVNRALKDLGPIEFPDTSLTSAANQTEYALPLTIKYRDILDIEYQGDTTDSNDYRWIPVSNWKARSAAPGSTGLLIIPQLVSGRGIKITYRGEHPALTTYSSVISEEFIPEVVAYSAAVLTLEHYISATHDKAWQMEYNRIKSRAEELRRLHPVIRSVRASRKLPIGTRADADTTDEFPAIPTV